MPTASRRPVSVATAFVAATTLLAWIMLAGVTNASTTTVEAHDNVFAPVEVTITAGNQIVWSNTGSATHSVTFDDASQDDTIAMGASTTPRMFGTPGDFAYHCKFHGGAGGTGMHGIVHVTAESPSPSPSTSASPSPTPSGPSSFTLVVQPSAAVWGTAFVLSGRLICFGLPIASAPVKITKRIAGTSPFANAGTTSTAADGTYRITHKPDRSADYRAEIVGGTGACNLSASSLVRADVRVGVITNVAATRIPRGSSAVITGAILPAHAGRKVYLQVLNGRTHAWETPMAAVLDSSSHYRFSFRRTGPGFLLFRVVFATVDRDHMWNVGRNVRVDWT